MLAASYPATPDRPLLTTAFGRRRPAVEADRRRSAQRAAGHLDAVGAPQDRDLIDSRVAGVDEALIRKLVIETALEHHLVSPYTSLVAVDKTPARSAAAALERRNIDNTMPAGAQWQAHSPRRPRRGHCCAGSAPSL